MFNLLEILPPFGKVQVIDVGAMDLGSEIYDPLVKAGVAGVLGFRGVRSWRGAMIAWTIICMIAYMIIGMITCMTTGFAS